MKVRVVIETREQDDRTFRADVAEGPSFLETRTERVGSPARTRTASSRSRFA